MNASSASTNGILYIVATPIGNLGDISARAIETLKSVDHIIAEDTRHTQHLLNALGIKNITSSFHAHNESKKTDKIILDLMKGQSIALVSDAGTPLVSDPGYPLVKTAYEHHITVVPIPGPCAYITALSAAGIACDLVTFAGFLPAKQNARQQKLAELLNLHQHTLVFYESTHRIEDCLNDMNGLLEDSFTIALAKELTKSYETFKRGTCQEILHWFSEDKPRLKGEFVIMIPPREVIQKASQKTDELLQVLLEEIPLKQAVKIAATLSGCSKNDLYQQALSLKKQQT